MRQSDLANILYVKMGRRTKESVVSDICKKGEMANILRRLVD